MMDRRTFLGAGLASSLALAACTAAPKPERKRVAITMDDFNLLNDEGAALARDAAIRAALPVQAAGFVSGQYESKSAFNAVMADWAEDGHILANHTYSHGNSSETATDIILADIDRNHDRLSERPGFQRYFRFPFLADGRDRAQQAAYYAALEQRGYRHAPVTIDTMDWYVEGRLKDGMRRGIDPKRYRDYWIGSVLRMADYADQMAVVLGQPNLPHQMLVHHLDLDGRFLGDLVSAMQADGWTFVPAQTALDHPFYRERPPRMTAGRSLLDVHKQANGLTVPIFPKGLRKFGGPTLDALGL